MLAFQIAFDLFENEDQDFLINVINQLPEPKHQGTRGAAAGQSLGLQGDVSNSGNTAWAQTPVVMDTFDNVQMTDGVIVPNGVDIELDAIETMYAERLVKIKGILSGETTIHLILQFLYSHNRSKG